MTADFFDHVRARNASTAGNVGTEIKLSDDTRTLLGMIMTNPASGTFLSSNTWRGVISWFNRRNLAAVGASTGGVNSGSGTHIEITTNARAYFLTWADEAIPLGLVGTVFKGLSNEPFWCHRLRWGGNAFTEESQADVT